MRSERARWCLAAHAVQLELALMSEEALHAWADELRAWAQWLVEVALNGRSPVTGLLRPLLRQRP